MLAFLAITLALLAYLCVRLVRHKPRRQEKGQEPESATSAVTHPRRQNRLA
ncbi:MAG TPA: hypothetical protein VG476_12595 [Acidimicrobiales bacterium]|nr:hypothetical protein [Acidimicrobiales bacterium]